MEKLIYQRRKISLKRFKVYRRARREAAKIAKQVHEVRRLVVDGRFAGHPVSRVFRHLFEAKRIRHLIGLQMIGLATGVNLVFAYNPAYGLDQETELTYLQLEVGSLTTESAVRLPLESNIISQRYSAFHRGVDFDGNLGDPIYPIMNGKVETVAYSRFSYGNHVMIDHGSGIKSLYAHLAKIAVTTGQEVDKNSVLGTVGSTGFSTGSHLHLEVYQDNGTINPLSVLRPALNH